MSMAQCITCGTELHPERDKKYNYCMARECQEKNAKGLTMVAVGMNKAAEELLILIALADIAPAGAEVFQSSYFSLLVAGAQVKMEPVLGGLSVLARHEAQPKLGTVFCSEQVPTGGAGPHPLEVERPAPEGAHGVDIHSVDNHPVDLKHYRGLLWNRPTLSDAGPTSTPPAAHHLAGSINSVATDSTIVVRRPGPLRAAVPWISAWYASDHRRRTTGA